MSRVKAWKKWTADEDDVLRAEYGKIPIQELASKLRRSAPSVVSRAVAIRVTWRHARPWTAKELAEAKRLRAEGLTGLEIGQKLQRHPASVNKALAAKTGRQYARPRVRPRELSRLRALHAEGLCDQAIARKLGRGRELVVRWRTKLGLPRNPMPAQLVGCGLPNARQRQREKYRIGALFACGEPDAGTPARGELLVLLRNRGSCAAKDLVEVGRSAAMIARMLRCLRDAGLVQAVGYQKHRGVIWEAKVTATEGRNAGSDHYPAA